MKYAWIDEGSLSGPVTGLNRGAMAGEIEGSITPQELTWGMDSDKYKVVNSVFTPKSQAEIDPILVERTKQSNAAKAKNEQDAQIAKLIENDKRKTLGIPPLASDLDEEQVKEHVAKLQADIDNPSDDEAYQPPLPPGVTPPNVESLTVTVTREEGWEGNLGFRVVLGSADPNYVPTNLALSVYSSPGCTGYLYTTGAFQYDGAEDVYYAICPAGQEPGDVDIHMGLLYGAAELSCFTMPAGVAEKTIYAYQEV